MAEPAETIGDAPTDAASKEKHDQAVKEKPAGAKDKPKADKLTGQRGSITRSNLNVSPQAKVLRYMPTYRLEPKNPINKERLEIIMKATMDKNYTDEYMFHPKHSLPMAAQVGEEVKNRIKVMNYDRYRYIVVVTVGEHLMQGFYSMVNFLWDAEKDGFVTYLIETPRYFAVCTIYFIYFD